MQYLLSESEYANLMARSEAFDEIDRLVNERPSGNIPSSFRFDQTINAIMDKLDDVKAKELERNTWKMPWFRNTEEMLEGLNIRSAK